MIKFLFFIIISAAGYYYNFMYMGKNSPPKKISIANKDLFLLKDFSHLRETLFTKSHVFLEVNLSDQSGKMVFKDGTIKYFPLTSGTEKLKDGIETGTGIFVIQSKEKKWHSRQFDSTLMLNWMGFNFGIGFHALANNVYYQYLGKKRSSHGCIRISREDALEIYELAELGTPVIVHNGESAVTIGFAEPENFYSYYTFSELNKILPQRLKNIYDGKYFFFNKQKLLIEKPNIHHIGLGYGNKSLVPLRQQIPQVQIVDASSEKDRFFFFAKLNAEIDTTPTR